MVNADERSGAAQSAPRRDDCGRKTANQCDGVDGVLSVGGGCGGKRYARDFATAPVSEGGDVQVHASGEKLRGAREVAGECRDDFAEAWVALPDDAAVHGGYGICVG